MENNHVASQDTRLLKALITGGTGFIGSHLTEALLRKEVHVRCLVRNTGDVKWLKGLPIELVQGDCNDRRSLEKAVKGVDSVFHLAGVTKAINEESYFEVNHDGTDNLVRACLEHNPGLHKFIYVSTQAAAGPNRPGHAKKESDLCEPVSSYGRSKRRGEEAVLAHAHELPVLILRPSAVYGPRDKDVLVLFKSLFRRVHLCPAGHSPRLSLCYVQDIVHGILLAVGTQTTSGEIVFLSDGHDYGMEEIGDIIAHAMGITPFRIPVSKRMIAGVASLSEMFSKIIGKPSLLNKDKAEEMIQEEWVCDITKAATILGFAPKVPLTEGARLTFEWYKKEKWL